MSPVTINLSPHKDDPGWKKFYCEKYMCHMFVKACVARQAKKHTWGGIANQENDQSNVNHTFTYPGCAKCKQGKEILAEYRKFMKKGGQAKGG